MNGLSVLLDKVEKFYRRFVVMTAAQYVAVTLWTVHTHAIDAAEATPYMNPSSPAKKADRRCLGGGALPLDRCRHYADSPLGRGRHGLWKEDA